MTVSTIFTATQGPDRLFLADQLRGGMRRLSPGELQAELRGKGVELVGGVARFAEVSRARSYAGHLPVASAFQVFEARLLSQQAPGYLAWDTEPLPDPCPRQVVVVFALAMGNGAAFPQPSGRFDLSAEGEPLMSFTMAKRPQRLKAGDAELFYDVVQVQAAAFGAAFTLDELVQNECTFTDGLAFLRLPPRVCRPGRPVRLRIDAVNRLPSANWVRVGRTYPPSWADVVAPGLARALEAPARPGHGGYQILFGDLHNHSGQSWMVDSQPPGTGAGASCGVGTRESLFQHARDVAGLDFFCLSEHDWQLSETDWKHLTGLTEQFNTADGSFVTLHGWEWTSANYGHRNVYFRGEPGPWSYAADPDLPQNTVADGLPTPEDLWATLRAAAVPAITVPHHMSAKQFPFSLDHFYDADFDRVAEIYSCWGDSLEHGQPVSGFTARVAELAFINSVRAGYRVGFVASSDSHDGHPGTAQGTEVRNHLYHYLGSGQTGVLAAGATREDIFDAIAARRCFAVTGERLVACTELDGHPMGSVLEGHRLSARPALRISASSFLPLSQAIVYRNGEPVEQIALGPACETDLEWRDPAWSRGEPASYFAKIIRADGEQAWTSPIWVTR